jgi:hypothetical protein
LNRKDIRSVATTHRCKDSEGIATGEVGLWPNAVSIEGGIIQNVNNTCDQDAGVVSIEIFDMNVAAYENLLAIASRACSPI